MRYKGPSKSNGNRIFVKDTAIPADYNTANPITSYSNFILNIELHSDRDYATNRHEKAKEVHQSN